MTIIQRIEATTDDIDSRDERLSGVYSGACVTETTAERYRQLGRPYLRSAGYEEDINYVVVMSPLMSQVLASAPLWRLI